MSRQRWGAFSVIDHKDPARLAPEVLLYDRLVFPVPASVKEKERWERKGWEPGAQEDFIGKLGDIVVKANWGYDDRKSAYHEWARRFANVQQDAAQIVEEARQNLGYPLTRFALAQQSYPLPKGVDSIEVVAAHQSSDEFNTGFYLDEAAAFAPHDGLKLSQKLAVPLSERDPKGALESAVQLARESEFRLKRASVYELQDRVLSGKDIDLETVQDLEHRTEELIRYVTLMTKKVAFTFAFAVVGVQPGVAAGRPFRSFASGSTTLSPAQFRSRLIGFNTGAGPSAVKAIYHD